MSIITTSKALQIIQSGQPFTFQCVTCDRARKRGGKIIEGEAKLLIKHEAPEIDEGPAAARPMTDTEAKRASLSLPTPDNSRNPNHHLHFTRNIVMLADGHPVHPPLKIHPPLLIKFNGLEVVP